MIELFRLSYKATSHFQANKFGLIEERNSYLKAFYTIYNRTFQCKSLEDVKKELERARFFNELLLIEQPSYEYWLFDIEHATKLAYEQAEDLIKSLDIRFVTGYNKND